MKRRVMTDDELLTPPEVAEILRIPLTTLRQWRHRQVGPRSFRLGGSVRYRRSVVETWLSESEGTTAKEAWTP